MEREYVGLVWWFLLGDLKLEFIHTFGQKVQGQYDESLTN